MMLPMADTEVWTFTCPCGYTSDDQYTVEVISGVEGACPECGTEVSEEMFRHDD